MKVRAPYELPDDKEEKLRRAIRLEWVTLGFLVSIVVVMGLVLGSSQAMKAAWLDDVLSLIPPIAFLVAVRFYRRPPDESFPYGYRRAVTIAFLCAALALVAFGGYLVFEAILTFVRAERPTIGTIEIFGNQIWLGWLMIAALVYSIIPPVVLGYMKLPLARDLHAKALHADADMNKADWMTAIAAIIGIIGIGYGFWWADAAAAGLIGVDVLWDGLRNLKDSVADLMDERPRTVDKEEIDDLPDRLCARLRELDWVRDADTTMREEGNLLTGTVYVVPRDETDLLARVEEATKVTNDFDWRIYEVVVTPVRSLE